MSDHIARLRRALSERYTIEREIGSGGMATVYLAEDLKHRRKVAIKVLKPELAASVGAERFLREIEIAARLNHPHILPLLDSGTIEEQPSALPSVRPSACLYYVMPFVEGESLRDRLGREKQLLIDDAVRIAREVAAALGHAHNLGVIHRDIKPENILLSADVAVVADFGIARAVSVSGGDQLTETGMAVGTPAYMSPEQATADEVDGRTDIYSLGCVLYEMLGGEPPYTGATQKAVLARKLTDPVPSLRALRETVPVELEQTIEQMLAKAPADRYPTADSLAQALATSLTPATEQRTAARPASKISKLANAALVVLVIGVAGWKLIDYFQSRADSIERLVVLPPANLMRDTTQDFFIDGIHDELIARLNQIPGLDVIGRTSAIRYRDTDKTAPEIARELDVDAVLESSVLWSGDSVRIQAQLIDAFPRERHIWQATYTEPHRDILSLHSQIAMSVAEQIHATLLPEQQARLSTTRPVNPAAHQRLLLAKHLLRTFDAEDIRRAIDHLEQAIASDSDYAEAYATLAIAYHRGGNWFGDLATVDAYPLAINAVERALRLDSTLASAHAAYGNIRFNFLWDLPGAELEYLKALELDPGSADTRMMYAGLLRTLGRADEGLPHIRRALDLDPVSPGILAEACMVYRAVNQPDSAAAVIELALELDPDFQMAYVALGIWRFVDGNFDEAIAMLDSARGYGNADELRALVYAGKGESARARTLLDSLVRRSKPDLATIGRAYAALGEDQLALDALERGYRERSPNMVFLRTAALRESSPLLRLRTKPQFQDLLRRIGLPPLEER